MGKINLEGHGMAKGSSANDAELTPAEFEKLKKELIEQINSMTYEDDPHIILITAKHHDNVTFHSSACTGFMGTMGMQLLKIADDIARHQDLGNLRSDN